MARLDGMMEHVPNQARIGDVRQALVTARGVLCELKPGRIKTREQLQLYKAHEAATFTPVKDQLFLVRMTVQALQSELNRP